MRTTEEPSRPRRPAPARAARRAAGDRFSWLASGDEDREALGEEVRRLAGDGRVDLRRVYGVLRAAKFWAATDRNVRGLALRPWLRRRDGLLRGLKALRRDFEAFYIDLGDSAVRVPLERAADRQAMSLAPARAVLAALATVETAVSADPIFQIQPRRREGHQPQPWLKWADAELRKSGIAARETRVYLLQLIDLKPPR